MAQPRVTIIQSNGNLGRLANFEDGIAAIVVSGVAVGGKFALGDVLGPFNELKDVEAKGVDEDYDATNTCLAWRHCKDFYDHAPVGAKLYLMVVAKTVTMTQQGNKTLAYAKKLLETAEGKIKLLAITRVPDGAYSPVYADEFEQDLWDAITNLQALYVDEFALHRPVSFIIEGRDWQGDVGATLDMRDDASSPKANRVTVMMGQDPEVAALGAHAAPYAAVGILLGRAAGIPVNRNVGRVKDGALDILTVGYSDNSAYPALSEADRDDLNDKGFVFFRAHTGKSGYYFNDDHTASVITDDYSALNRGRVMDKASRIARTVYLEELLDEIQVDQETGYLAVSTVKHFQGIIEKAINEQMTGFNEISGVSSFVDPNQNVLALDKIEVQVNIVPTGTAKNIEATLAFENPLNA